jgi:hypothetical protein
MESQQSVRRITMKRIILTAIFCLIASSAIAAPKLCLIWEQPLTAPGGKVTAETRSRIFDTALEAVAFLEKRKIADTAVTGLWELRPAAKQVIRMTTVEVIEPEIIKEKRSTLIKWSAQ